MSLIGNPEVMKIKHKIWLFAHRLHTEYIRHQSRIRQIGNPNDMISYLEQENDKLQAENERLNKELVMSNARIRKLTVELNHLKAKDSKLIFKDELLVKTEKLKKIIDNLKKCPLCKGKAVPKADESKDLTLQEK